jgi:uncharacterized membrane protein YciS (DUF1049 family)
MVIWIWTIFVCLPALGIFTAMLVYPENITWKEIALAVLITVPPAIGVLINSRLWLKIRLKLNR